MDDRRFDALTKFVGGRASRRALVKGAAAAALAAVFGQVTRGDDAAEAAIYQQGGVKQRVRVMCNQAGQKCKDSKNPTRRCCYKCNGSLTIPNSKCCEAEGFACINDSYCCNGLICRDPNLFDGVNLKGCFRRGELPVGAQCLTAEECRENSCFNGVCCGPDGLCGGVCCGPDELCVNESCCPIEQACNDLCCPAGETCSGTGCCPVERACDELCCPAGETCSDSGCCPVENACVGGECSIDFQTCCPDASDLFGACPGSDDLSCYCVTTTEGDKRCHPGGQSCDEFGECTSSAECPEGMFCSASPTVGCVGYCLVGCNTSIDAALFSIDGEGERSATR